MNGLKFVILKNKLTLVFYAFNFDNIVKVVCGPTRLSPRGSTASLTLLWRNLWSITGRQCVKSTLIIAFLTPTVHCFTLAGFCLVLARIITEWDEFVISMIAGVFQNQLEYLVVKVMNTDRIFFELPIQIRMIMENSGWGYLIFSADCIRNYP